MAKILQKSQPPSSPPVSSGVSSGVSSVVSSGEDLFNMVRELRGPIREEIQKMKSLLT